MVAHSAELVGSRVLDDRFMAIGQALGIVKGRGAGADYLREFIEDVKRSAWLRARLKRAACAV